MWHIDCNLSYAKTTNQKKEMETPQKTVRSYILPVDIRREPDGQWKASIKALPGCSLKGSTRDGTLQALQIAAHEYLQMLMKRGQGLDPDGEAAVMDGPAVVVILGDR